MDDDGVRGVGGGHRRRSGRRSRDEHGRDGKADVGVGDGVIGLRRREHPRGNNNDKRGRSGLFDGSRRWERRVIRSGEGMQGVRTENNWRGGRVFNSTVLYPEQFAHVSNSLHMFRLTFW